MISRENLRAKLGKAMINRRLGIFVAGLGLGTALVYLLLNRTQGHDKSLAPRIGEHTVDDRGTGQESAATMLLKLRDRAFEASDEKLAVALGRPIEEINAWHSGQEVIDDDVVMKVRNIARLRGVVIE
ncbi:MAG: hypothetical protein JWM21_2090 [Acidobacteria bacterium]|nr:hypothetical protein [Acidobacteriota bacterium]